MVGAAAASAVPTTIMYWFSEVIDPRVWIDRAVVGLFALLAAAMLAAAALQARRTQPGSALARET